MARCTGLVIACFGASGWQEVEWLAPTKKTFARYASGELSKRNTQGPESLLNGAG